MSSMVADAAATNFRRTIAARLRTFLILGRASNLPTVWSNCLAGWMLGGAGELHRLALLCLGASFLYLGGMFLNDAFDAQFDHQHRPERPIPSGMIRSGAVWGWGLAWLLSGWIALVALGKSTGILATLLALSILIYDAIHKIFAFAPLLMAGCRFFLVLVAASVAEGGIAGGQKLSIWSALVLAAYITGLSYLARKESTRVQLRLWPCSLLITPIILALFVNGFQRSSLLLSALLVIWIVISLRHSFWKPQPNIGRSVSALLAGIVLVDWLSVAGGTPRWALAFAILFGMALLFQRFIPAT